MHAIPYVQVPYIRSNNFEIDLMLEHARIVPDKDTVYDPGSGDGSVVIRAVEPPFCARKAVGIEIDPKLVRKSKNRVAELGLKNVEIREGDSFASSFEEADVVVMYMLPLFNSLIEPILEDDLKPEARVVSSSFPIPGWKHSEYIERKPRPEDFEKYGLKKNEHFPAKIFVYNMKDVREKL